MTISVFCVLPRAWDKAKILSSHEKPPFGFCTSTTKLNGNLGHYQVLRVSPAVSVGLPVAAAVRNIMVKVWLEESPVCVKRTESYYNCLSCGLSANKTALHHHFIEG